MEQGFTGALPCVYRWEHSHEVGYIFVLQKAPYPIRRQMGHKKPDHDHMLNRIPRPGNGAEWFRVKEQRPSQRGTGRSGATSVPLGKGVALLWPKTVSVNLLHVTARRVAEGAREHSLCPGSAEQTAPGLTTCQ